MKKRFCLLLSLLMGLLLLGGCASDNTAAQKVKITCTKAAVGYTCAADWTGEDGSYELVLTGLPTELTEETAEELISAFTAGSAFTLTDDAIVDAEKVTNKLSSDTGTWVYEDENRQGGEWGDSSMCWAASTSDMLCLAGWAYLADDPETGVPFAGEDALFNLYRKSFINDGGFQNDGIHWFFNGTIPGETYLRDDAPGALLNGFEPEDYCSFVSYNPDLGTHGEIDGIAELFTVLKDGGAVGLCVGFDSTLDNASYNSAKECFERIVLDDVSEDSVEEHYYTYDFDGDIVVLSQRDGGYFDADGNAYEPISVLQDDLYEYSDGVYMLTVDMGGLSCSGTVPMEESEVTYKSEDEKSMIGNGSHAVTMTGYILKTDAAGADAVRAVFLADSDNDAALYTLTDENISPETRPNTYTMYPVSVRDVEGGKTLEILNYMPYTRTLLANITALKPAK